MLAAAEANRWPVEPVKLAALEAVGQVTHHQDQDAQMELLILAEAAVAAEEPEVLE